MSGEYKPKLCIELTDVQQDGLQGVSLPWGWQRALFSRIIDEVIEIDKALGPRALALIISGKIKPSDAISCLHEANKQGG